MRIAHISDVHIHNNKYHEEYRIVFEKLFVKLKEQKPDVIAITGDLAHSKNNISPEFVELCSWFLDKLSEIAETIVVPGNHDGILNNLDRQDALSPIINILSNKGCNIKYLKQSCEYHYNDEFCFNNMSIFDRKGWVKPTDMSKVNIALYHGTIRGCQTDAGFVMTRGDDEIDIFEGFDYGLLGDIHKSNQKMDPDGFFKYAGSLVQQNFGEDVEKGYLLWDIKDKENFTTEFIPLENPSPFYTITINENLEYSENPPKNARVRIKNKFLLTHEQLKTVEDEVRTKFEPKELILDNDFKGRIGSLSILNSELKLHDLREIESQQLLIKDYLEKHDFPKDDLNEVYELNQKYDKEVSSNDLDARNVEYEIVQFEWANLFKYGEGNVVNFTSLSELVGLFGKNFSGKSSFVDSLGFTLFNKGSKNSRKYSNILNKSKDSGYGRLEIKAQGKSFFIDRKLTRILGKNKDNIKMEVDFYEIDNKGEKISLNGLDTDQTNDIIRVFFGSLDDFLITSFCSQFGALTFVDSGSTDRISTLSRFLDLDRFAKKFDLANEDAKEYKVLLKNNKNVDFTQEIQTLEEDILDLQSVMESDRQDVESENKEKEQLLQIKSDKISRLQSISTPKDIDIDEVRADKKKFEKELKDLVGKSKKVSDFLALAPTELEKYKKQLKKYNEKEIKKKLDELSGLDRELDKISAEVDSLQKEIRSNEKKIIILNEIPCGDVYLHTCPFIKDAAKSKGIIEEKTAQKTLRETSLEDTRKKADELSSWEEKNDTFLSITKKMNDLYVKMKEIETSGAKNDIKIKDLNEKIEKLKQDEEEYEKNKENYILKSRLEKEIKEFETAIEDTNENISRCSKLIEEGQKEIGKKEQEIIQLRKEEQNQIQIAKKYKAYELFLKCFHTKGISYEIIQRTLPKINAEISRVLSNFPKIDVYFEAEDNKLEIYRKNATDIVPVEVCSGAEKMLAAFAIRIALINISNIPKPQVLFLDEPGAGSFDEDQEEEFLKIINMIKAYFKSVIIISHQEFLKNIVDETLPLKKSKGFAKLKKVA